MLVGHSNPFMIIFEQHFKEVKTMQGVTSTGNTENRGTSGEGSSTGTTQGQMQGGRSVQQQTSVQPTLQVILFCNGSNINYNDSNTRHIPASNWRRCNGISTGHGKGNVYKNLCQNYATRQQGIRSLVPRNG